MSDKKKKLAVIAAVTHYIKSQQEQAAYMQAQQDAEPHVQTVETVVTLKLMSMWGVSGRQQQMQVRNMIQLKAFHR